jgi:hypothetical protein
LFVSVPIKNVKIENISGNIIEAVENMTKSLTCKTSAGRPAANIAWKIISKNGTRTGQTYHTISDNSTLENGLTIVQSSINLKPLRGDNDSRITCEATNEISKATKSVTLYVQCKFAFIYFVLFIC